METINVYTETAELNRALHDALLLKGYTPLRYYMRDRYFSISDIAFCTFVDRLSGANITDLHIDTQIISDILLMPAEAILPYLQGIHYERTNMV